MSSHPILESWYATFLAPLVEHADTEEIAINRARSDEDPEDTEIFIKRKSTGRWDGVRSPITAQELGDFFRLVARVNRIDYGLHRPIVHATLPNGARLCAVTGENVRYYADSLMGIACNIRQGEAGSTLYDLQRVPHADAGTSRAVQPIAADSELAKPLQDFQGGRGVIFIGETSTGKTFQIRRFLRSLPTDYRIVTMEDTREITLPDHRNALHLFKSRTEATSAVSWDDLINVFLRTTADVGLVGEASNATAPVIKTIVTTGHGRFITTLHSSSGPAGLQKLYSLLRDAGDQLDMSEFEFIICNNIGHLVVLDRDEQTGRRFIREIITPEEAFADLRRQRDRSGAPATAVVDAAAIPAPVLETESPQSLSLADQWS
jgi:type IV secretion system protein VirB11